jgi:predicted O-methyltransferase YrrM
MTGHSALTGYRNRHAGATVIVCGCGRSVNELPDPAALLTIGVNDIGRLFDPTYLVVVNPRNQFTADRFRHVSESRAQALFTQLDARQLGVDHPQQVRFRLGRRGGTEFDAPDALPYTRNSPYVAVCLAAFMGAGRIGLIGVDFTDHHFFGATGRHALTRELASIDREYGALAAALRRRGVELVNLSRDSRLTSLPKSSPAAFLGHGATVPNSAAAVEVSPLSIVSYATTPVAGVPPILSRCISARTTHRARCVWADRTYGNGVTFDGDVEWKRQPAEAVRLLEEADAVIVHNGKVAPQHRVLLASKPVVTMAHNYLWNVDPQFVSKGFPGLVVGQYQATLAEFAGWTAVPNPVPFWEAEFQPAPKPGVITICYTPSGKHERYPAGHRLYWHGKGYDTTMRVLERLAASHGIALEVVRRSQISHAESLAMKRRAHIVIDECVTGSYHRNSLEGLAAGCVVINGVGLLPAVEQVFRECAGGAAQLPCTFSTLADLEQTLAGLIAQGGPALEALGRASREWIERQWEFGAQWDRTWRPAIEAAMNRLPTRRPQRPLAIAPPARASAVLQSSPTLPARAPSSALVSVVVPHGGEDRLPHLAATLAQLREHRTLGEIIVAEVGARPAARDVAGQWADKYVFSKSDDAFERGRALNVGSAVADFPYVVWLDNDLLAGAAFFDRAIAELCDRRLDYLVPYTSIHYLSERDSARVIAGDVRASDCRPVRVLYSGRRAPSCSGGAGLITRDFLLRHGGLLEGFRGWGGEDNAWNVKVRLLGRAAPTRRSDQQLHHLFHPSSAGYPGESPGTRNPHYQDNVALLLRVQGLRNARQFVEAFPPEPHRRCAWDPGRRIVVVHAGGDDCTPANTLARSLQDTYGANVELQALDSEVDCSSLARAADALLIVGDAAGERIADAAADDIDPKCVFVTAGTAATAAAGPLSLVLANADTSREISVVTALPAPAASAFENRSDRMTQWRNVFACLVHDNVECVIDLVRNLRYMDPASTVLLYNGGRDPSLLSGRFPFSEYGAIVHPNPQPMAWGRLHDYALDCMRFALDELPFDSLTIVDSDQLAARIGYSSFIGEFFRAHPRVGLAGNSAAVYPRNTRVGPLVAAYKERELWRPFLNRFSNGQDAFGRWTFWPSTVFSAAAARDLTTLFATDGQLQSLVQRTQIWASEEVLFPMLTAVLGHEVAQSPCSYEYVKHRVAYSTRDLDRALTRPGVFWIHPINRTWQDPLRAHVRARFNHYERAFRPGGDMVTASSASTPDRPLFLTTQVLARMRAIEGWLEDDEADVLIAAASRALEELPTPHKIVEVGSYCGRSTTVLGAVAQAQGDGARVYAIDPHDGVVGALDQGLKSGAPTLARFQKNIADAGLSDVVVTLQQRSFDVAWNEPISLLFIDGLHDYANVARDFLHFERHVAPGGYIAFHDYADYYPGVKAFVNELLASPGYERVVHVRSMMLVRKSRLAEVRAVPAPAQDAPAA